MRAGLIEKSQYRRSTWKNGLGFTDQIAIFPESSDLRLGNFLWRISSAQIQQDSPFSPFPDHDRVLVILRGAGVRLTHDYGDGEGETVKLPLLAPYDFPGDVPSKCELLSGPVLDLSVFLRKGEVEAMTDIVDIAPGEPFQWEPAGRWNFAFAAEGSFQITSAGPRGHLTEGDSFRVELDGQTSPAFSITADEKPGKIVLIALSG